MEANVFNIKGTFEGHSIANYLNHYAEQLHAKPSSQMFVKKLSKLLVNERKYLYAVRDLPADAPGWAQEALQNQDLFYFKPDADLNDIVSHLMHYVAALEQDMEQDERPDDKVVATKNYQAFNKAENLAVLAKTSQEYFKRGSKKAAGDTEGMNEIFDAGGGFVWWKLTSNEAFRREGKTLQNCIGSHYTEEKTKRDGTSILVMKDKGGITIVGARVKNKQNELVEMKGKNNKPPVAKYMPPVAKLINKFKFNVSSGAHNDIVRTGYFYADQRLYTMPEAKKKFTKVENIGKISQGYNVVKLNLTSLNKVMKRALYNVSEFRSYSDPTIFEARDSKGFPVASCWTNDRDKNNKLSNLKISPKQPTTVLERIMMENAQVSGESKIIMEFVNMLSDRGYVESVDSDTQRGLFLSHGLSWSNYARNVIPRESSGTHETGPGHHKWEKYEGLDLVKQIFSATDEDAPGKVDEYKRAFMTTIARPTGDNMLEGNHVLIVFERKDGAAIPLTAVGSEIRVNHTGHSVINQGGHGWSNIRTDKIDPKAVKSIIGLVNDRNLFLPKSVQVKCGIIGDQGKYERFAIPNWQPTSGEPKGKKIVFDDMKPNDMFPAIYHTLRTALPGGDAFTVKEKTNKATNPKIRWKGEGDVENNEHHSWQNKDYQRILKDTFGVEKLDAIYRVDVGFGVEKNHGVMLLVDGKTVVEIDNNTEKHKWQGWDDYNRVADQLNKFVEGHGLKLTKTSTQHSGLRGATEFRVGKDGRLTTAASLREERLTKQKGKEGVDEMKFADGWVLQRMDPKEQSKWIRTELTGSGLRGDAWALKDTQGEIQAIVAVQNKKITTMFGGKRHLGYQGGKKIMPEKPNAREVSKDALKYLKTAMKHFGWTNTFSKMIVKYNSPEHKILEYLEGHGRYGRTRGQTSRQGLGHGISARLSALVNMDLVDPRHGGVFAISRKGEQVLKKIKAGEGYDIMDEDHNAVPPHHEFKLPEKKEEAKKEKPKREPGEERPRATRPARGGTKASQALDKFTAHVEEHGRIPTRGEFIATMQEDPFNMSSAGAQTYYYTTKKKYANLNEQYLGSLSQLLLIEPDLPLSSFRDMII